MYEHRRVCSPSLRGQQLLVSDPGGGRALWGTGLHWGSELGSAEGEEKITVNIKGKSIFKVTVPSLAQSYSTLTIGLHDVHQSVKEENAEEAGSEIRAAAFTGEDQSAALINTLNRRWATYFSKGPHQDV